MSLSLCIITTFYTFSDCRICMLYTLQSMLNMPCRINLLFLLCRMNLSHCLESIHMSYKDNANLFHHCRRIFISTFNKITDAIVFTYVFAPKSCIFPSWRLFFSGDYYRIEIHSFNLNLNMWRAHKSCKKWGKISDIMWEEKTYVMHAVWSFIRKLLHQRVEGKEVSQEENFLPKHQRVKDLCQRAEYQTPCQQTGQVTHTSLTTYPSRDLQHIISHPSSLY